MRSKSSKIIRAKAAHGDVDVTTSGPESRAERVLRAKTYLELTRDDFAKRVANAQKHLVGTEAGVLAGPVAKNPVSPVRKK